MSCIVLRGCRVQYCTDGQERLTSSSLYVLCIVLYRQAGETYEFFPVCVVYSTERMSCTVLYRRAGETYEFFPVCVVYSTVQTGRRDLRVFPCMCCV